MNTAQLAYRVLRHTEPKDIAALSLSQSTEIVSAISSAIAFFFRRAPDMWSRTSASIVAPAPQTIGGISLQNGNIQTLSGSPFTTRQRGSTVIFTGDGHRNEITGSNSFLNPYLGTTGIHTATIWGDAIPIQSSSIQKIVTDPWISLTDGRIRTLQRAEQDQYQFDSYWQGSGEPHTYSILPTGIGQGSDTQFILRLSPAPSSEMIIRFGIEFSPEAVELASISREPIELPLSDSQAESILVPLVEREMLATTIWKADPRIDNQIETRAIRAEELLSELAVNFGRDRGMIRTKLGY